jgi:hypothetical protein
MPSITAFWMLTDGGRLRGTVFEPRRHEGREGFWKEAATRGS